MNQLNGCQLPGLPRVADGLAEVEPQPFSRRFKRLLAKPWNSLVKKWLKYFYQVWMNWKAKNAPAQIQASESASTTSVAHLEVGDWVRVRSLEEIQATLNPWKELKGCAFLPYMAEYCGTKQRVLQPVQRFLDERDYKVKKTRGVVLLEGVICKGTPVFGRCDRCCFLFWREEWLEKVEGGA